MGEIIDIIHPKEKFVFICEPVKQDKIYVSKIHGGTDIK